MQINVGHICRIGEQRVVVWPIENVLCGGQCRIYRLDDLLTRFCQFVKVGAWWSGADDEHASLNVQWQGSYVQHVLRITDTYRDLLIIRYCSQQSNSIGDGVKTHECFAFRCLHKIWGAHSVVTWQEAISGICSRFLKELFVTRFAGPLRTSRLSVIVQHILNAK